MCCFTAGCISRQPVTEVMQITTRARSWKTPCAGKLAAFSRTQLQRRGSEVKQIPCFQTVLPVVTSRESCGDVLGKLWPPQVPGQLSSADEPVNWGCSETPGDSSWILLLFEEPCGCIQEWLECDGQGWGAMTADLKFKAFFQKTHFVVQFQQDVPSQES